MINDLKILFQHGKQYIPDPLKATLTRPFRGLPVISRAIIDEEVLQVVCPTQAISIDPVRLDLGKCVFCGECAFQFPDKIAFTSNHRLATNERENLICSEKGPNEIRVNPDLIRKDIMGFFGRSLKLRQVSAGGDNSAEMELNAAGNVNFDMGRYGIEFVASPRHADGLVITGPLSSNMAQALEICYEALPSPKILILAGTDAISGGIFHDSPALNRSFLDRYKIDLFVPGNPPHPLTFLQGILELIRR